MTKNMTDSLIDRLQTADVVCTECGCKYGKYSADCSSMWTGTCHVCGETKPITEVRDWGYLTKGINELNAKRPAQPFSELTKDFTPERKARIKKQSKKVADYMLTQEPIMTDEDLDGALTASYEQGEITLKLSKDEVGFLNECLDVIVDNHESLCSVASECPEDIALFESIEKKITDLYQDHCVKFRVSPAILEYNKKYGTWGTGEDAERWEKFKNNYSVLVELGFIT
jgi:hypothetical protein